MPTVVSSYWNSAVPIGRNSLMQRVLQPFGFQRGQDTEIDAVALNALDEVVNDLNMGLYEFNKRSESGITLTSGQSHVDLGTPFYRDSLAYLVKSTGEVDGVLAHIPWVQYERQSLPDQHNSSVPYWYSLFNTNLEGRAYLYPSPNSTTATDYTLTVEYYRRIPRVSDEDPLEIPREVENVLIYGGQKRLALHFEQLPLFDRYASLEQQALDRLKMSDHNKPDAQMRWRLPWQTGGRRLAGRSATYIRVT